MLLNPEFSNGRLPLASPVRRFEVYSGSRSASPTRPAADRLGIRFAKGFLAAAILSLAFWVSLGIVAARLLR
jgi:hypothetical protein